MVAESYFYMQYKLDPLALFEQQISSQFSWCIFIMAVGHFPSKVQIWPSTDCILADHLAASKMTCYLVMSQPFL